jgi:hypothetical protein
VEVRVVVRVVIRVMWAMVMMVEEWGAAATMR